MCIKFTALKLFRLHQEHQFRAGSITNCQRGPVKTSSFFLDLFNKFVSLLYEFYPSTQTAQTCPTEKHVFSIVYRNTRPPGPFATDDWRSLTCLLAFDLMVVSLVFWILYKTSTLAGLVSWRGKQGWLWCIDLWKEKKSSRSLQGMCVLLFLLNMFFALAVLQASEFWGVFWLFTKPFEPILKLLFDLLELCGWQTEVWFLLPPFAQPLALLGCNSIDVAIYKHMDIHLHLYMSICSEINKMDLAKACWSYLSTIYMGVS